MNQPNNIKKRILLAGGATGGPVAPLLAVAEYIRKTNPEVEFLLVGTPNGPEEKMAADAGIQFKAMRAAKLRRYFSLQNLTDIFVLVGSLFASRKIISDFKPQVIFCASGFVGFPLSWVGRLMGVKIIIHQQDAVVSLTYRLIAPIAHAVTCVFQATVSKLKAGALAVGNPIRPEMFQPADPLFSKRVGLNDSLPVIVVIGGASGALQLNSVLADALPELLEKYQVVHVTGRDKPGADIKHVNYFSHEFLSTDYAEYLKRANLVVSRAGLGAISDLSALGKPAIIVPMPGSHQEQNARLLESKHAAVVLGGPDFSATRLVSEITRVMSDTNLKKTLSENIKIIMPHDAAEKLAKIITKYVR